MYENKSWQIEDLKFILNRFKKVIKWKGQEDEDVLHYGHSGAVTAFLMSLLPQHIKKMVCLDLESGKFKSLRQYPKIEYEDNWKLVNEFDHVFSFYGVDGGVDFKSFLTNTYAHTKPNGDLLLVVLKEHSFDELIPKLKENANVEDDELATINMDGSLKMDTEEIKKMLGDVGYESVLAADFERYQVFPNGVIMKRSILSYLQTHKIPEQIMSSEIDRFILEQVDTGRIKFIGRNRNVLAVHYTLTFIYAQKFVRRKSMEL